MDTTNIKNEKLSKKTLIGYGVGGLAEGIGYNFFFAYFLFFLTNIVGIAPAIAGVIALIAVLWDGISDPLIGYLSDNSNNPKGKRRPFILIGAIAFAIATILLFTNLNLSTGMANTYFIIVNILYWTTLTTAVIPHTSLGAEITDDYNERTKLRSAQTMFMNTGAAIAISATLFLVGVFKERSISESRSWTMVAVIYGCIIFISYFSSWYFTAGKEPTNQAPVKNNKNFFKEYRNIFKNKPLRYIIGVDLLINIVFGIASSIRVYLYTYNFGYSDNRISSFLLVYSIALILGVFIVERVANKLGKKTTMILGLVSYIVGFLILFFLPSTPIVIIMGLLFESLGNCTFWVLLYSLSYDATVIEEYKYGEGREGILVSMIGLAMKAGNAIGLWLSGIGLSLIGFNAALTTQAEGTITGLKLMYTVIPAIVLIVTVIMFSRYPLTEEKYNRLREIVDLKSKNKEYSTHDVDHLL